MGIRLRPCRPADVEQVLDLWRRASAELSVTDDPDALRRRLGRERNLFILAWDRDRLVIDTARLTVDESVRTILSAIRRSG